MKVILFMAISLNGIVARENNEEDFLSNDNWGTFVELAYKTGCIIWGRKTCEVVQSWDKKYSESLSDVKKVVVTTDKDILLDEGYIKADSPRSAIDILTKRGFSEVILSGGSKLNSSFAKMNLINEIILNIDPVIIGKGIPLFDSEEFDLKLSLLKSKRIARDTVQLRYRVR